MAENWEDGQRGTDIRNNLRNADYRWNLGEFVSLLPLHQQLLHGVQAKDHGSDSQAHDCRQLLLPPL